MLSDPRTIDVIIPVGPDALMLVISDTQPWAEEDSNERYGQYLEKLNAYCRYVADDEFGVSHPGVAPTKVLISVVSLVPASWRMRQIRAVHCQKLGSKLEIPVSYADETKATDASAAAEPSRTPSHAARADRKNRLLTRGLTLTALGAPPLFAAYYFATNLASLPEFRGAVLTIVIGVLFWAGALVLAVGVGMILWSQQK